MITATAMMAETIIPSQFEKTASSGDISPWVMIITSTTLRKAINMKATKIMIQAALAREALSSHKAPIAAMTWSKADEMRPMMVSMFVLVSAPTPFPSPNWGRGEGRGQLNNKKTQSME